MEIKATLQKPYTENERMEFIVQYNHNQGYVIEETEMELQALGYSEEELVQQERERIAKLFLTGADVERAILKARGMDFDDVIAYLPTLGIDETTIKVIKVELKANNFYRGNPYVEQIGTLLGFTSKQLNLFFDTNNYKYLTNVTLAINATPTNAVVVINNKECNTITVPYNTEVSYEVTCEGYESKQDTLTLITDTNVNVELEVVVVEETDQNEETV